MPDNKDYFNDVDLDIELDLTEEELLAKEEKEKQEEEQRQKNKDAEEARKRREAEEKKAKEEEEAKKLKEEEEAKAKEKQEQEQKQVNRTNELGKQLSEFKDKYPDIDIAKLDEDPNFKKFINGKLLGKQDFTKLYEEFKEMRINISGETTEEAELRYKIKQESSSGQQQQDPTGEADIYSEEELAILSEQAKSMNPDEYARIEAKFYKSIAHYEKNKK